MVKYLPYCGGSCVNGQAMGLTESMFRIGLQNQERYYQPEDVKLVRVVIVPRESLSKEEQEKLAWDDDAPMQFDSEGNETC